MKAESNLILGKPNLNVFSETLINMAHDNADVLVVTSDSRGSGKLVPFAEQFPDRLVEVGIAEQNLVGIAAGLASCDKIVYAVSPASFLTARALEQIKNDVCYADQPVKLIGISAGVSYGALGSTHHATHDLAVLRAINNITITIPADNFEAEQAIKAAAALDHPIYIRFGKRPMYHLHPLETQFEFAKALTIKQGDDIAIVATGETVYQAWCAAEILNQQGYATRLISMHTIKPLDKETLLKAAHECQALMTVEEHSIFGGLGEACAHIMIEAGVHIPFQAIGFPDEYMMTGSQLEIFDHYGIGGEGLAQKAVALLNS